MSHYDYLSPHMAGLAGPVEDLAAVAVKSVATHVGNNREAAWNYFRFGIPAISASEAEDRIKRWADLTTVFKAAMDALKPFMFVHVFWMDLKDFKLEDKLRLQADLKSKFDAEWAKAFPSSAPAPASTPSGFLSRRFVLPSQASSLANLANRPVVPAGAGVGPSSTGGGGAEKKFPIVPVAIGAAVVAVLLLRRK